MSSYCRDAYRALHSPRSRSRSSLDRCKEYIRKVPRKPSAGHLFWFLEIRFFDEILIILWFWFLFVSPVASSVFKCGFWILLAGQGSIHSFCYLSRYALARNIWMEILLKLSAVALVTLIEVVRNEAVVKLCLGVTVATAGIVSLAQPYLQPQINRLQCICLACLSATAVGFAFNKRWLSRAALCLPFVFAAWQLRRHRDGKGERVKACSKICLSEKWSKALFVDFANNFNMYNINIHTYVITCNYGKYTYFSYS